MRGIVLIGIATGLTVCCLVAPAALAQCYVWSWFEPYDLQVDHGQTATAGVWITGPGYPNVTSATFTWYNPYGVVTRTLNIGMTSESAAKLASDSYAPSGFDGYWRVLILYHSQDLSGGYQAAPTLQFYYGTPPPTTTIPTTTTTNNTISPTPTGTTPTLTIASPTTAPTMVTLTLQSTVPITATSLATTLPTTTTTPGPAVVLGLLALVCAVVLLRPRR